MASFLEDKGPDDYDPLLLERTFAHWHERRFGPENGGRVLRPRIKADEIGPDSDPYICFRRREVKQLRKARRSDTQSVDKLKRLRDELLHAREILELVALRETARREILELEQRIFDQRILLRRVKKKFGIPHVEAPSRRAAALVAIEAADAAEASMKKARRVDRYVLVGGKIRRLQLEWIQLLTAWFRNG